MDLERRHKQSVMRLRQRSTSAGHACGRELREIR